MLQHRAKSYLLLQVHMKRDGTFSIQVLGDKEIVIQQSDSRSYERLYEDDTVSDLARISSRNECSDLLIATAGFKDDAPSKTTKPRLDFASVVNMVRKSNLQSKETRIEVASLEEEDDAHVRQSDTYSSIGGISGLV